MSRQDRSAIVLLADGARADVFERMLAAGELPEIERHVTSRGGLRRATSTFTSTTIPAHLPFLTGRFAGSANVPGYRWFDRTAWRPGLPTGPWCLRSYNGPEATFVDRDIAPDAPTIFELTRDPVNVFGSIGRGVGRRGSLARGLKNRLWLSAHYRRDYVSADEAARDVLVASLDSRPDSELRFAVMPGIDWNSHYDDPFGDGATEAYRRVDRAIGSLARKLQRRGSYEKTLLVVCSDHGHCPVGEHFDIAVRMERDHDLRVAYHSAKAWRRGAEVISCVSGNGMAHVYFRPPGGDWREHAGRDAIEAAAPALIDRLLNEPAIDLIVTREGDDLTIESSRGRARLNEDREATELRYCVENGRDPFGFGELPERMSFATALDLTADSGHPDALLQITQLFRSSRTGDLVVSAAPGFDLRERFEHPEHVSSHGALHDEHMHVPLAVSAPLDPAPMRTTDAFSTVLQWLGRDDPAGVDGVARLTRDAVATY